MGVGARWAGKGHAQPVGALPLLVVQAFADGRGRIASGRVGRHFLEQGQGQLGVTGRAETFPQIDAARDAVRIELDLAVAERDGCVGKGFQWQHFAGEG